MAREFSKKFYKSKEWSMTRDYILKRDNYLCQHCGRPAQEVHHIIHLSPENINDPGITMNPNNLTSLCRECHFKEHYHDKGEGRRKHEANTELDQNKYEFDSNGMLIQKS